MITAILLVGIAIYQICHITGPTLYPDEFGYWANAAGWLSFDWSDTVALQSYYSFGYSIILLPILKLIRVPLLSYRAAVLVNVLLVYLHAVLLWNMAWEWKKREREKTIVSPSCWYCLFAAFYPSVLFYMQTTLTETLISLLFVLSVWLLLRYINTEKVGYGIFFVIAIVYLHFVHMRTIGVLAAGILTICLPAFQRKGNNNIIRKKKLLILLLLLFILMMATGNFIKDLIQTDIYRKADLQLLKLNDYSGRIEELRTIFTRKGLWDLLVSCIGKLFYLGLATLGTFYFGMWYLWKRCKNDVVSLFLFLSVLFTFGIVAATVKGGSRGDIYIYGRYNEFLVPVIIYFGLCEMSKNRYVFETVGIVILVQGIAAGILVHTMADADPVWFQGYFVVGISYVLQERMADISHYILYPLGAGSVAMLLLSLVMRVFIRKKKSLICYLGLFIMLFIFTVLSAGKKYLYDHSYDTGEDMAMVESIKTNMEQSDTVLFINSENDVPYVDIVQFCLREYPLEIIHEEDVAQQLGNEDKAEFVLSYKNSRYENFFKENYHTYMSTYHFDLYYNRD